MNIEHTVSQQVKTEITFGDTNKLIQLFSSTPNQIMLTAYWSVSGTSMLLTPTQLNELAELLKQFSAKHKEVNGL